MTAVAQLKEYPIHSLKSVRPAGERELVIQCTGDGGAGGGALRLQLASATIRDDIVADLEYWTQYCTSRHTSPGRGTGGVADSDARRAAAGDGTSTVCGHSASPPRVAAPLPQPQPQPQPAASAPRGIVQPPPAPSPATAVALAAVAQTKKRGRGRDGAPYIGADVGDTGTDAGSGSGGAALGRFAQRSVFLVEVVIATDRETRSALFRPTARTDSNARLHDRIHGFSADGTAEGADAGAGAGAGTGAGVREADELEVAAAAAAAARVQPYACALRVGGGDNDFLELVGLPPEAVQAAHASSAALRESSSRAARAGAVV